MKEIVLFTSSRSVDDTIKTLGRLGVMDIKKVNPAVGASIERRLLAIDRAKRARSILEEYTLGKAGDTVKATYAVRDPKQLVDRVLKASDIRGKCQDRLRFLSEQIRWYRTWGDTVDIKDFEYLRNRGIHIRLYQTEKPFVERLKKSHTVVAFQEQDGKIPLALITRDESEKPDLKESQMPELSLQEIQRQIKKKKRQLSQTELFLKEQTKNLATLDDYLLYLQDRLGVQSTLEGMGDIAGRVKYLKGYIPHNAVEGFISVAKQNDWGYSITEPDRPEEVPVYIKNPKWISIIDPVMKFIDIVPGYKEVDVSIYFLVAFALFFAMLVGDAGYGLVFLLATFLFRKKLTAQMRILMYVLSGATIIWGMLSGTYFGAERIAALPYFNTLVIEEIASFGVDNIPFMMHLSFLIGAIHLTVAHGIRVFQFINSLRALSEIGWISLVWGLFLITEQLVLGKTMPEWGEWLFIIGAALVALFSVESKSFFGSMLISLANLPLSLISGFSDIVSYVRLFAVGMATAAVAASFNHMILPNGVSDMAFLDLVMAAIALVLGHGLNIALALMAVMVHGIRLNMLEFAGHLGVQFSGEAYKPFTLVSPQRKYEGREAQPQPTG